MAVFLIGGEKGGTGKSTTATNLAVMASIMGHDVLLVDATIKQASSAKFIQRRCEAGIKPTPTHVRIQGKYLHNELVDLSKRYEYVIVDAGGTDTIELRSAMTAKCIQKMYSPVKPSDFDLATLEELNELVYLSRSYNPDLNCYIYFNQAHTTAGTFKLIKAAEDLVREYECLKLAKTIIFNRLSIQTATGKHLVAVEYEEERRQIMPKYQIKSYLFKGSLDFCAFYKEVFDEDFNHPSFITLKEHVETFDFKNWRKKYDAL